MKSGIRPPFKVGDRVTPRSHLNAVRLYKLDPRVKYVVAEIIQVGSRPTSRLGQKIRLKGVEGIFGANNFEGENDLQYAKKFKGKESSPPLKVGDLVKARSMPTARNFGIQPGKYYKVRKTNGHDESRRGQYVMLEGRSDRFLIATGFQTKDEKGS